MAPWMWGVIAAVVVVDALVMGWFLKRMRPMLALQRLTDPARRQALMAATDALVKDHLGHAPTAEPGMLQGRLAMVLPRLVELWRSYGIDFRPGEAKTVLEHAAMSRRVASRRDLRAALTTIAD